MHEHHMQRGEIIIFPSEMYHYVDPSVTDRVTISFNVNTRIRYSTMKSYTTAKATVQISSHNISHDASVAYLEDGQVVWMIEEERLTHRKHDAYPFLSILRANNIINRQSLIAVTVLEIPTLKK